MSTMPLVPAALAAATLLTAATPPIVLRHDRDDADYRALARDYPTACDVGSDGQGVLVAPRWVLTAAHVAQGLSPYNARVGFAALAESGERDVVVDHVVMHPGFSMEPGYPENDIALLRLAEPVTLIAPAKLYTKSDEAGREVVLVGCGQTGDGRTGARTDDHTWRGATNRVRTAEGNKLFFRFDQGDDATDLEGFWGGGDSGSPCYILTDDGPRLAGIGSHGDDSSEDGLPGTYGDLDVSYRVSFFREWIEEAMAADADAKPNLAAKIEAGELPRDGGPWECIAAWFGARAAGVGARTDFENAFRDPAASRTDLWGLDFLPPDIPELSVVDRVAGSNGVRWVRAQSPAIDEALVFRFDFASELPVMLGAVDITPIAERPVPRGGPGAE